LNVPLYVHVHFRQFIKQGRGIPQRLCRGVYRISRNQQGRKNKSEYVVTSSIARAARPRIDLRITLFANRSLAFRPGVLRKIAITKKRVPEILPYLLVAANAENSNPHPPRSVLLFCNFRNT
jgi:hypothetical protein